jgi:hypothetical protein
MYYIPTNDGQWQQVQKEPLRLQQDPIWTAPQTISEESRLQSIMKGVYNNGKSKSFGTRLVQWQDNRALDTQTRMDQLGELK